MNKILENYLYKEYPDFFVDVNKSPKETCMCWGCSCGDGWFLLLNSLCQSIKHRVDNHNRYVQYFEDYEKEYKNKSIFFRIKQSIKRFLGKPSLKPYKRPKEAEKRIFFKFKQIKEKFGFLTIYSSGGDGSIHGYISFAKELSRNICEKCGKFDATLGSTTKGWIQSICQECSSKDQSYAEKEWKIFKHNTEIDKLLEQVKIDNEKK